jgi:hypothetical protein
MSDILDENTETEVMKDKNVPTEINVSKVMPKSQEVKFQGRLDPKYVKEVKIEYLKNPDTGRIFPANETIMKQRHLIPCDKDGNVVHDNRQLGRFN